MILHRVPAPRSYTLDCQAHSIVPRRCAYMRWECLVTKSSNHFLKIKRKWAEKVWSCSNTNGRSRSLAHILLISLGNLGTRGGNRVCFCSGVSPVSSELWVTTNSNVQGYWTIVIENLELATWAVLRPFVIDINPAHSSTNYPPDGDTYTLKPSK